ncbi:MAG TPA: response regulator transcription factor [Thermoanaerobaculia bacterium]|nr:response regulator transcription factor [Thermoanaerobaculia bacterium]
MIRRPVRVLMIWRHRALGEAVAASLAKCNGIAVVGAAGSADEAARLLAAERADVALLDASVDVAAALDLTAQLQEEFPRLRILPFGVPSHEAAVSLIEAGAAGCLSSAASLDELAEAILEGGSGRRPASLGLAAEVAARIEELSARAAPPPAAASAPPLSERELEVLVLLARGLGNKEIAPRLDIRTSTVKNHVHSILSKLGAQGRRQAVRIAYEQGLLRGPLRWRTLDDEE